MTEDDAKEWLVTHSVSRETFKRLEDFEALLLEENRRQNLIAKASEESFWSRHVVDSAQLIALASTGKSWLDVGSGAGLPGIIVAILLEAPVVLVEPRAKRCEFLQAVAQKLGLAVRIEQKNVQKLAIAPVDVITARAVAALSQLFAYCTHLVHADTLWILPKGRRWEEELASATAAWQGQFSTVASVTDPDSRIVVARGVKRR